MTPDQRQVALRLAEQLTSTFGPRWVMCHEAAALLRELAAEPVLDPVAWEQVDAAVAAERERVRGHFLYAMADTGVVWPGEVDILFDKCVATP